MASIRFGIRNMKLKTYPIEYFSIREEEAEEYALQYDKLDIWNQNKTLKVSKPQIEKRVNYFHIMFIPIFSTGVDWTTRKKDGKIYFSNKKCKDKIIDKIGKNKLSVWYFNLIPIILLLSVVFILFQQLVVPVVSKSIYRYEIKAKYEDKLESLQDLLDENYGKNVTGLKKIDSTYFIEFQYLNVLGNGHDLQLDYSKYAKIISIRNNHLELGFLPDFIDEMDLPSDSLKKLFEENEIQNQNSTLDSISKLIPKNLDEIQLLRKQHKNNFIRRMGSFNDAE